MMSKSTIVEQSEIEAVSGGGVPAIGPAKTQQVLPQDMYGDTMSVEAWMDYEANVLPNHPDPHDGVDPHDFPGGHGN